VRPTAVARGEAAIVEQKLPGRHHRREAGQPEQIASYHDQGFLHIPRVFTAEQTAAMREGLNWMIESWAAKSAGWTGPCRKAYMDEATEAASKLIPMHDLYFYAQSWMEAVPRHHNPTAARARSVTARATCRAAAAPSARTWST